LLARGRTGFYLAIERERECGAGDPITRLSTDPEASPWPRPHGCTWRKTYGREDRAVIRRTLRVAAFPERWKAHFRERLA
jgi:hypothetical protein